MPMVDDYLRLVTAEHRKPKFLTLVAAAVKPFVEVQELLASMPAAFDVDLAVGAQLDAVGLWVGIGRTLSLPMTGVYFSWEAEGIGWEEGVWRGPFDQLTGLTTLHDDAYRRLIKAKIAANHWDGSIPGAYAVWEAAFGDTGGIIIIQDNQDMSMAVGIAGMRPDAVTQALLLGNYIPLKPEGVRIEWYAVTPDGGPLFAWDCENEALAGWETGRWAAILRPDA